MYDYLIVGAGFAGSVLAEKLSGLQDKKILVIDKRSHIGGNAFDYYDQTGILIHKYGPHIFHTNSKRIFNYLSRFTKWRFYEHRVKAYIRGKYLPFPINIRTVNLLFGLNFSEQIELEEFFKSKSEYKKNIVTIEDYVVSKLGRELYELFFRDYSLKQWGIDPGKIDASVAARIPVRTNFDDRYFTDKYQFMPQDGYTKLFERLLSHRSIEIALNTDYEDVSEKLDFKTLIFTGPIDSYFKYQLGRLKYRSLNFSYQTVDQQYVQEVAVINYPNDFDYTRTTEFKHLTGQNHHQTTIMYEFPSSTGDPYYPVKNSETNTLLGHYEKLSRTMNNVHFVGRLGTFQYLNMDQVVGQSLKMFEKLKTL